MEGHLVTADGVSQTVDVATVTKLLDSSDLFWLDLDGVDEDGLAMLTDTFKFHPLAVEDAEHFGQRPKLDLYDDFALFVILGASESGQLVEVHCFYTDRYLITVHHQPCPALRELSNRMGQHLAGPHPDHVMLLYRVVDTLVDGFFPVLATFDDRIDEMEDEILARPTEGQLGQLFDMKRSLIALRKAITPQRDLFATIVSGATGIPGMTPDAERYFRDLYDHLIRISDLVDSYRDLLSGALDTHLSTVSNRLNVVMKQLTIIATVFLPLSFLTGFFGQNFGWLVGKLSSLSVFVVLGIGLQVLTVVILVVYFWRRGWLSGSASGAAAPARRPKYDGPRWRSLHALTGADGRSLAGAAGHEQKSAP